MTYTIRPVRPTDLAAVTEVEAICFPAAEAAAEESFKARIAAFPECFFVAEADGKIIGFINGCATDSKTIYDEMYENSACTAGRRIPVYFRTGCDPGLPLPGNRGGAHGSHDRRREK